IFTLETHLPPGLHGLVHHSAAMHDYQHMVHGTPQHQQHAITPQQQQHHHHHQQQQQHPGDFDHEPLLMSMHNPAAHYYSQSAMNAQMLHVSADYPAQPPSVTSASSSTSGSKRSREDLNMKEKKRMFKLNDRINQLKDILDEAGVQCKKNKQSILDHTHHYIGMLRSNLLIAQQKAERAEKQTEAFRAQAQKSSAASGADVLFKRCFDQSSTARLVTDLALQPITYNHAFLGHSGLTEQILKKKDLLRQFLCVDSARLDQIVSTALDTLKATSAIVQARTAGGDAALTLVASVITDDFGKAVSIEFSLIPFEISSDASLPASYHSAMSPKREMQEASPSGVSDLSVV
ncbi:hypothetical protein PybrP1_005167, partial [[Pythium] brassicae (nom. inval.)]